MLCFLLQIEPNAEDGDSEDGAVSSGKEHKKDEETNRASISERILQEEINVRFFLCTLLYSPMNCALFQDRDPNDPEKMSRRKLRLAMQPSIAKLKEVRLRCLTNSVELWPPSFLIIVTFDIYFTPRTIRPLCSFRCLHRILLLSANNANGSGCIQFEGVSTSSWVVHKNK